jgi:hypothetical protein
MYWDVQTCHGTDNCKYDQEHTVFIIGHGHTWYAHCTYEYELVVHSGCQDSRWRGLRGPGPGHLRLARVTCSWRQGARGPSPSHLHGLARSRRVAPVRPAPPHTSARGRSARLRAAGCAPSDSESRWEAGGARAPGGHRGGSRRCGRAAEHVPALSAGDMTRIRAGGARIG